MAQFTLFSGLPKELRDEIWDAAIRDDGPAAHFFTTYDVIQDDPSSVVPAEKRIPTPEGENSRDYTPCRLGLAAPRGSDDSRQSWVDRNESAYMTDSGLWTACWESRERMLKRFPLTELPATAGIPAGTSLNRNPVTMPFLRDNGERQYLTIRPWDDLLCLQFARGSRFALDSDSHWSYTQAFPLFMWWWLPVDRWWSPGLIRNVAVEFSPAFEQAARRFFRPRNLMRGANGWDTLELPGLDRFWLISSTLERKYRTDEDRSSRRRFRAGGGMELVEVLSGDDDWRDPSVPGPTYHRCRPGLSPAHDLAYDLQRLRLPRDWDPLNTNMMPHFPPRFGVLACVRPGTERDLPTESEWLAENSRSDVEPAFAQFITQAPSMTGF